MEERCSRFKLVSRLKDCDYLEKQSKNEDEI
jgi:hypothetical protein